MTPAAPGAGGKPHERDVQEYSLGVPSSDLRDEAFGVAGGCGHDAESIAELGDGLFWIFLGGVAVGAIVVGGSWFGWWVLTVKP